jgi:hypothetical protein
MSFLASFVTGFATQAQKDIEERDKELRDEATMRWNSLLKEREKAKLRVEKRSEEIDDLARKLRAYGVTDENQIVAAISSGIAPEIVEKLSSMKEGLTSSRVQQLIKVEAGQEIPTLAEFRKKATELQPGMTAAPSEEQMRGAFGLKTRAYEQSLKSASAQTGVSTEDIYRTKLPEVPSVRAAVDLSVLAPEKTEKLTVYERNLKALKDAWAEAPDDVTKEALSKQINAYMNVGKVDKPERFNALVDDLKIEYSKETDPTKKRVLNARILELSSLGKKPEGDGESKAPTRADHFRLLKNAERTAIGSVETRLGGATFVDSADGRMLVKGIDADARSVLNDAVNNQIREVISTVSDTQGRVPQGMREALASFGIKTDKNGVPIIAPASAQPPAPVNAAPASGVSTARARPATRTVVRTGTVQSGPDKGKKVIEYSDGTREIQ